MKSFILASASPRRSQILSQLKIPFQVIPSAISENLTDGDKKLFPKRLAESKALDISEKYPEIPVLGFDTLVFYKEEVLGKPKTKEQAKEMLLKLNGQMHSVISGVALAYQGNLFESDDFTTEVYFRNCSLKAITDYIETSEPLDKAGAYAIQGQGAFLVEKINGCYYNVVGLPLSKTLKILESFEDTYGNK